MRTNLRTQSFYNDDPSKMKGVGWYLSVSWSGVFGPYNTEDEAKDVENQEWEKLYGGE